MLYLNLFVLCGTAPRGNACTLFRVIRAIRGLTDQRLVSSG